VPGLLIAFPSRARDVAGLLRYAFTCEDPVLMLEHKHLLRQPYARDPFPPEGFVIPFGRGTVVRPGTDVTVVTYGATVERSRQAQGPGERSALVGEVDAARVGVHGRAPSRQTSGGVGDQPRCGPVPHRDDAQQGGLRRRGPAPHAGAHRTPRTGRGRCYRARRARGGSPAPGRATTHSASLWMSIRQPVRRAARRAFCPSLPIASESW